MFEKGIDKKTGDKKEATIINNTTPKTRRLGREMQKERMKNVFSLN